MEHITSAPLPIAPIANTVADVLSDHDSDIESLGEEDIEQYLKRCILNGQPNSLFQLGHFYFENQRFSEAKIIFEQLQDRDYQAKYLLAVMYYDGIGVDENPKLGVEYIREIALAKNKSASHHLISYAQYNLGRAYYQGYGIQQSNEETEKLWTMAAQGDDHGSVMAQTALGLYYSQEETLDVHKAFYWHKVATENGSLESQGALGAMYWKGQGTKQNTEAALNCFKQASDRGNVYAQGCLVAHYYNTKLHRRAVELAKKVTANDNISEISKSSNCLPSYVAKGIAIACFYYARCLHNGLGISKDPAEAKLFYSKACKFDLDVVAALQQDVTYGFI